MRNDVIKNKLARMEEYLTKLQEITPDTFNQYEKDWKTQMIAERGLQLLVEIIIDVANRLIAINNWGPVTSSADAIRLLALKKVIKQDSDLDMAVYFFKEPDLDQRHELMESVEKAIGRDVVDLLVLNGCEDFILRHEVLKGDLIFCRDVEFHASFFSWTNRMYEDQKRNGSNY